MLTNLIIILTLISLAIFFILFIINRRSILQTIFAWITASAFFWILTNFLADSSHIYSQALLYTKLTVIGPSFIPALFVHFSLIFNGRRSLSKQALAFIYLPSLVVLMLTPTKLNIVDVAIRDWGVDIQVGPLYSFLFIYFLSYFSFAIFRLIKTYRSSTKIVRLQLMYILFGVGFSSLTGLFTNAFLVILGITRYTSFGFLAAILFIFFTYYAITRYRLMDIRFIVSRSILYFLMVALVSSFFVFTTFLTTDVLVVTKEANIWFNLLASFVIVIFIDPLKRMLSRVTDDIFYQGKINYDQVLTKLGLVIAKEIDLEILISEINRGLLNELKLKRVEIIININGDFYTLRAAKLEKITLLVSLVQFLKNQKEPSVLEELRRQHYDMPDSIYRKNLGDIINVFESNKWEMSIPVVIENELVAVIALDNKLSGDIYTREDINFFNILAPQVAVAIEKSKLYEEINKFNQELQGKIDRATEKLKQTNIDLESRNKFLTTTQNISNLISRSLDINNIIQIIADSISSELGYIGGILSFVDESGKKLYPAAITRSELAAAALKHLPKHPSEYRTDIASKENLGAQAFLSGTAIVDTQLSKFLSPPVEREAIEKIQQVTGIKTVVAVPIYSENKIIGVIEYLLAVEETGITRLDYEMMNNLADQIGIVYRNVKLYQELQSTNVELQQANVHLKQLDKAKSEFLSIASHQLRTPISAVKGYLSMLLEGDFGSLQPEQAKIITDIFESASRLARLINIFLNVSRIESGRFKLSLAPTDMNAIVESVIKELQQQAKVKNLELKVELPKGPIMINVDSDKIREVILNLVDNAIKYTQEGSITVSHELKPGEYHFMTKDTGMGILPEEVGGLFRKFVRGSGVAQVNTQGSGLGLYIAQRVVGEHGGKIWAESAGVGKGSTFQFTVPVAGNTTIASDEMKNGSIEKGEAVSKK